MSDLSRLSRLSGTLHGLSAALCIALPVVVGITVLRGLADPSRLAEAYPDLAAGMTVGRTQALIVALIAVAAVGPMVMALRAMAGLFARYRAGEVLSEANAARILSAGRWLIAVAVTGVLVPTLQILVLTWQGPQRSLRIGLDGDTLGFLMAAGFLTVIGWAMREAARVKAENEAFV